MARAALYAGTFFHAPIRGEVACLEDALVEVNADGIIAAVTLADDPNAATLKREADRRGDLVRIGAGAYVLPGFVDLHIHAPQYPQLGTALHLPLEVWLQQHTFPLEARYADLAFAGRVYEALIDDLLAQGTTTALMFATVHADATRLLVDHAVAKGMRALIGKVAMDNPDQCPDFYRDASVDAALAGTRAVIDHARAHLDNRAGLVRPVVTPRFIPSCTDALLGELGAMAKACGCHIQTHCSESDWEHGYVQTRMSRSDTESLDGFGLLTRHTILAHGTLLTTTDMDRIASRGAGVAHCPLSNVYFSNAVFPLKAALAKGLRVGLGTDIAGGPSASMFDTARMAVAASRLLDEGVDPAKDQASRGTPGVRIDWQTAFHLATAGGAAALDLPVGTFEPGRAFDAMVIDTAAKAGTVRLFDEVDDSVSILQKILFTASRTNVRQVFVQGRAVAGTARA
ncbi:Guanine deaminase [Alphaproteobacteria bacterium SO-S41]|nr:Guanine deaminase [Alphaproteobacteria bacterium SO-S41]